MPGSAITISAVDLDKAVIFPLPCGSPTDVDVRCAAAHKRRCSCAQLNILDPKYLGCTRNTVRICVYLHSRNDRGVFRAPNRTSWATIYSPTRSLWCNDEAGREKVCSMVSWCDIANVVDVITCQRGKQYWPFVESSVDWFSVSVGTLTLKQT